MKEPRHEKLNYESDRYISEEEWGRVTGNMKNVTFQYFTVMNDDTHPEIK